MSQPLVLMPGRTLGEIYRASDDVIRARIYNSVSGLIIRLCARVLLPSGDVVNVSVNATPTSDRLATDIYLYVPTGQLLTAACFAETGNSRRGQCWCQLSLRAGRYSPTDTRFALATGYIIVGESLAWPGGDCRSSTDGAGGVRSVAGTNPAAGVEVIEAVPTNARWRVRTLRASLVTDATVATRTVNLIVDDGTTTLLNFPGVTTQTASLTRTYNIAEYGFQPSAVDTDIFFYIPFNLYLYQGWRIRTSTTNLQAGDNWGAPQLGVEEWIED